MTRQSVRMTDLDCSTCFTIFFCFFDVLSFTYLHQEIGLLLLLSMKSPSPSPKMQTKTQTKTKTLRLAGRRFQTSLKKSSWLLEHTSFSGTKFAVEFKTGSLGWCCTLCVRILTDCIVELGLSGEAAI